MPHIPDSIKTPGQIIDTRRNTLKSVYDHARELLKIQAQVRQLVPGDIYVAHCSPDELHLITPSSALATRLKYNQRKLVAQLRQVAGVTTARIRVSVRPDYLSAPRPEPAAAIPLSAENARHIASAAKYIEDEDLRKALINLSKRANEA